jgi:hypothetical protein
MGDGPFSTRFLFYPTADGQTCITLQRTAVANSVFSCCLRDFRIYTNDTSYDKTAIKIIDGAETALDNIAITTWAGTGTDSVGIRTYGRESFWANNLLIDATCPIVLDKNPNTSNGWLSVDHFTFHNLYLLNSAGDLPATLASACIQVMDGAHVSQLHFTGSQSWVGHRYGFYWVNASALYTYNTGLDLGNFRTESGLTPATYYSVYISLTSSYPLRNMRLGLCEMEEGRNGVYTRNVRHQLWDGSHAMQAGAIKVFDIDCAAEGEVSWRGVSSITTAGASALTLGSAWSMSSAEPHYDGHPYPSTATWVRESTGATYNQRPFREMSAHTWHWAGTVTDDNFVNLPVNNTNNWEHARIDVTASIEASNILEYATYRVAPVTGLTNGVVKDSGSTNAVVGEGTDARLCLTCTGASPMDSQVRVMNRLGATAYVTIEVVGKRSVET